MPDTPPQDKRALIASKKPKEQEKSKATLTQDVSDSRHESKYQPLIIRFLRGAYADKPLELGTNIIEQSQSQTATWDDTGGEGIRQGCSFKSISTRQISLELEYYSLSEDVSQLVENLFHMQEITDNEKTPPLLELIIGKAIYKPVVCESIEPRYEHPLPGLQGFRSAKVSLRFKAMGGKDSAYQLAPPYAPTPLKDQARKETEIEREKKGTLARAKSALAECLGEEGNKSILNLIENNQLSSPNELLKLSSNAFVQLLASGGVDADVLKDDRIKNKIKRDVAYEMAANEDGLFNVAENPKSIVSNAIATGNPAGLSQDLLTPNDAGETLYDRMRADYQIITDVLEKQKFDEKSPIFDRKNHSGAFNRMNNIAGCGLKLRNIGGIKSEKGKSEAEMLSGINKTLADKSLTDKQVAQLFGLLENTPETVIRKIRNGHPYTSKAQFLWDATHNQLGATGYGAWAAFADSEAQILKQINSLITKSDVTDAQIQEAFGISDPALLNKIKNNKRAWSDKEAFLRATSTKPTAEGEGNQLWVEFWKKNISGKKPEAQSEVPPS